MQQATLLAAALVLTMGLLGPVQLAASNAQRPTHDISSAAEAVADTLSHGAHAMEDAASHVRDAMLRGTSEAVSAVMHLAHTAQRRLHAQDSSNGNGNGKGKDNRNKGLRKNPWSVRCSAALG